MRVWRVSEVTRHVKALLDMDGELADLWVEGEISSFSRASSGHCYFTLKDSDSELRCVIWRIQASRLDWTPSPGDWVEAHGQISVYERGGVYQFYADSLAHGGVGARWREFQALKERLQAEGLFAEERKRALPRWPQRIGVVTSPVGAAFQDILKVLRARYPLVEIVLSPSLVQGEDAPAALVQAMGRFSRLQNIDVIIIARGGGSLEDLWAFNDEQVARAVAASRVPVVAGVGHETDFTIVDFVADLRAPTPSAAAAATVPDGQSLRKQIQDAMQTLGSRVSGHIGRLRGAVAGNERLLRQHEPQRILAEQRQRVDDLVRRACSAWEHFVALRHIQIAGQCSRLQALDPRLVLGRGYAIVQDSMSGRTIVSVCEAAPGQGIAVHLCDGHLEASVTEVLDHGQAQEGKEAELGR